MVKIAWLDLGDEQVCLCLKWFGFFQKSLFSNIVIQHFILRHKMEINYV